MDKLPLAAWKMAAPLLVCLVCLALPAAAQPSLEAALGQAQVWAAAAAKPKPADWSRWFSDGLFDAQGAAVSTAALQGKVVGIYFSASYCFPCQIFTPQLVAFREKHKAEFEVVFVGEDIRVESHKKYMEKAGMPWPAVPFGSASAAALEKRYPSPAIPQLVILSPSGKLLALDAVEELQDDGETAWAGWKKKAGLE